MQKHKAYESLERESTNGKDFVKIRRTVLLVSSASVTCQGIIGLVAIVIGVKTESSGTLGFGLETWMDISTTLVVLWQYYEKKEMTAKKEYRSVIALASLLILLSIGMGIESLYNFARQTKPNKDSRLMIICGVGFCVYAFLGTAKMYLGERIKSKAVFLDGLSTIGSASLAAALLASLTIYDVTELWFLDGVVTLLFAILMISYVISSLYKDGYLSRKVKSQYTSMPGETVYEKEKEYLNSKTTIVYI